MRILNTLTVMFLLTLLGACAGNNTYTFALYNRGIDVSASGPADRSRAVGKPTNAPNNLTVPVTCHYTDC